MTDDAGPDIDINAAIDEQQDAQQREIAERLLPDGVTLDSEIFIVFEEKPGEVQVIAELGDAKITAEYRSDHGANQMQVLVQSLPAIMAEAHAAMEAANPQEEQK